MLPLQHGGDWVLSRSFICLYLLHSDKDDTLFLPFLLLKKQYKDDDWNHFIHR